MGDIYDMMMKRPEAWPVNRVALDKLVQEYTGTVPTDTLRTSVQHQLIDHHNAQIDKRKAERKQLRQIAKQARVSVTTLKKMLGRA